MNYIEDKVRVNYVHVNIPLVPLAELNSFYYTGLSLFSAAIRWSAKSVELCQMVGWVSKSKVK